MKDARFTTPRHIIQLMVELAAPTARISFAIRVRHGRLSRGGGRIAAITRKSSATPSSREFYRLKALGE
ncbi:MAG: hypothetical protein ABIZ49_07915 [Opitutaceae bacterium]